MGDTISLNQTDEWWHQFEIHVLRAWKKIGAAIKLLILVLCFGCDLFVLSHTGKGTSLVNAPPHLPIDLTDEIENVPIDSWSAVPIQVPYNGFLTISARVRRGNAMTMMLTDSKGIQKLKTHKWGSYLGEFYASKTVAFEHTGRVHQGTYYFVIRDKHNGAVLPFSSDVSVKARIEQ
jgi:hypothetical protein